MTATRALAGDRDPSSANPRRHRVKRRHHPHAQSLTMLPTSNRTDLTPIASLPALYNPRDLALIRRTVAIDTTDDEFALFVHWARSLRLDPLRRQIHAFVFNKNDPKKRRLSLVTSIEGFRAIAARTGNYRPDENEPAFICDDALKSDNESRRPRQLCRPRLAVLA